MLLNASWYKRAFLSPTPYLRQWGPRLPTTGTKRFQIQRLVGERRNRLKDAYEFPSPEVPQREPTYMLHTRGRISCIHTKERRKHKICHGKEAHNSQDHHSPEHHSLVARCL